MVSTTKIMRFPKYDPLIKLLGLCLLIFVLILFFGRLQVNNTNKVGFGNFGATEPTLPQVIVNSAYPVSPAGHAVYNVKLNCTAVPNCFTTLQPAVDAVGPGDEIVMQAGATFAGNVTLPNKTCTLSDQNLCWIIIRTSNLANLPREGSRVGPADAPNMTKIVAGSNVPAIRTAPATHHYRLVGLEFAKSNPTAATGVLVLLGVNDSTQTNLSQVPHDLVLDRVYVHGDPASDLKRGVELNSSAAAVVDSYISDIHVVGQDAQAIAGFNGPGPYRIVNNYLEASTENVIFGGSDPQIQNLVPSDIEFKNNYLYKPRSWRVGDPSYAGKHWAVKNILELKNSQRVLVEGNIFDGNWVDGQSGRAIVFTPRNQDGNCNWCVVQDVTFQKNIVRHSSSGLVITGYDNNFTSALTQRIKIYNNLWEDISGSAWGGDGKWILLLSGKNSPGPSDVQIVHNTAFQTGNFISPSEYYAATGSVSPKPNTVITDNIAPHNSYGVIGDNTAPGNNSIDAYFPGGAFTKNILMGGPANIFSRYPGNYFPSDWNTVFVNQAGGDYHVLPTSIYHNAGTDGKDLGADINAIASATANTISGKNPIVVTPVPVPIPSPIISFTLIGTDPGKNQPIAGFDPIPNGAIINLATLPTRNLTILANMSPTMAVGSINMALDGVAHKENTAPFGLCGDTAGSYTRCPSLNVLGSHSLVATPFPRADFSGTAGTPLQLSFSITDAITGRDAFTAIQAESFDSMSGVVLEPPGVGRLDTGDWLSFKNVNFGAGASMAELTVAVAPAYAGKQIELRLDSRTGTKVGTLVVKSTGGWTIFQRQSAAITAVSGLHDLYLVMNPGSSSQQFGVANLDSFKFIK